MTPTRKTDAYKLKNTNGKDLMDFDRFELKRYHGPLMFKTCYPLNNTGRISYHRIPFTKDRGWRIGNEPNCNYLMIKLTTTELAMSNTTLNLWK